MFHQISNAISYPKPLDTLASGWSLGETLGKWDFFYRRLPEVKQTLWPAVGRQERLWVSGIFFHRRLPAVKQTLWPAVGRQERLWVSGIFFSPQTSCGKAIGHLRVVLNIVMKISLHSNANNTNFYMKSFELSLAFIMRFTATRKWPIQAIMGLTCFRFPLESLLATNVMR